MSGVRLALSLSLLCVLQNVTAQCPATDFTFPASACLNQTLQATNASSPGSYSWDFCSGDLQDVPTAQSAFTLPGVNGRPGIEFVHDGTKWFGFVTGTFTSLLYRLEFDNGLQAAPTSTVNLGSLGGALNQPGQIRIIKEGTQWFGLVHNTTGELLKLSFGTQLTNPITIASLISGIGSTNSGLSVGRDAVHGWVCVISTPANQFAMVRLGNSLLVPNPVTDVVTSATVTNPNGLGDVDIINICGDWFGLATNLGNGNVYRLDFGPALFSAPVITELPFSILGNPGRLRIAKEGEEYYAMVLALGGTLTKLEFGNDIASTPTVVNEGNIGGILPANMYGLGMAKENSIWTILGVTLDNGQLYRINYPNMCSAVPVASVLSNPVVSYTLAGTYSVTLENTSGVGVGAKTRSVIVSTLPAPDIDFSSLNNCAQNNVAFTSMNVSGNIIVYAWSFGDSQTSSSPNPLHTYATAGDFDPRLTVTASNSCLNTVTKTISMYNPPVSDFTLPTASPVCTNQDYFLSNTTTFDPLSNPAWEWQLNGMPISSQQDITLLFSSSTSQEIRLKAIIPGCENEVIKNIASVLTGPLVDFSAGDDCAENVISFVNLTTGADTGYVWDFGDGSPTTTFDNPQHTFSTAGVFQVTLTGSNLAGCLNQETKAVRMYSVPEPDFSVGLPPFSCSNSPTAFQNDTQALTDSNIIDWVWQFADAAGGFANVQNPSYTYTSGGDYLVELTATSDRDCSATLAKLITIGSSPLADFSVGPSCYNQATHFTDISSGGVQSRLWQIGSSTFGTPNPSYTFTAPGDYVTTLTVTGANGCSNVETKTITVPVAPVLQYSTTNPCAGKSALFADGTSSPADAVVGWNWNFAGNSVAGNPAEYVFDVPAIYNAKMTTTHASGCVYTLSKNITINASPTASFTATPDRGEAPLTVQFNNSSVLANQYNWTFFDQVPAVSTHISPVYTFVTLGDYSAQLTATNSFGCVDVLSLPIIVLVPAVDLIMTDFSLNTDPVTGKLRSVVTILNNSNVPVNLGEVGLFLSDKAVVNETLTLNLSPGQSTVQTLSFTLSPNQFDFGYLCAEILSEKDIQSDNNKRCISFEDGDYFFDPYPSPSSGVLQIDWITENPGTASIVVHNAMGQKEYAWETQSEAGLNQTVHDLTFLSAGLYFVSVQTSRSKQTTRFLRQ